MAASSMKDIKQRIKSIKSTMQITKAMELVASSKLRRARERVARSRPYFETLRKTLDDISSSNTEFQSPYLERREVKNTCCIVIGGDRGLAGGYNTNIFKKMDREVKEKNICVLPIGKRTVEHYTRAGVKILSTDFAVVEEMSVSDCFQLSQFVTDGFLKGDFDEIQLGYTKFVSMLSQTPVLLPILPFCRQEQKNDKPRDLILYDPDNETVFNAIVPEYLAGMVYGAICESFASELGARRTAMDSASKNAEDMIGSLSLRYNRARQAAITQEITEISAGAEQ